jgi:outer membrane protein assembly factor BamB
VLTCAATHRLPFNHLMLSRLLKGAGIVVGIGIVGAALLYLAGMRIVLYGGGTPHFEFVSTADSQAAEVARHREAQRAAPSVPAAVTPLSSPGTAAPSRGHSIGADGAPASTSRIAGKLDDPRPAGSAYWTGFRGPHRNGTYDQQPIQTAWPSGGPRLLWKQPIGGGYASFAIARGRAFTIEQRGAREVVSAYDVQTGRELWTNEWTATFRESMGGDGPRATPAWADGRVFALGGTGELRSLDEATGRVLWRTNILEDAGAPNLQWGMAASPLIVDDTVVVLPGGSGGRSVVAYSRAEGKRAWSALDDQPSYSSPMLTEINGVRQIVVFSAARVVGLTPVTGEVLWEYPWKTDYDVNASQPVIVSGNRVLLSSGYGHGAVMLEVTRADPTWSVREVWRNIRMKNQFSTSLLHEGYIYGLDESILACLDAATGDVKWKGGRYGYGQVVLASGHLIVLTESGELVLVRATAEGHQELVRVPAIDGKTWNHPAISDGYLLIRNSTEMAAFDLR